MYSVLCISFQNFFFSSRRRHTKFKCDWSSDVCSSDLDDSALDISEEIRRLQKKSQTLTKDIYAKLNAWQVSQVARHPQRPYTLDYVQGLFTDFSELHGDRAYADDQAIVGGIARFNGEPVMVIGHQKGRDTKEKIARNFGMPRPEGYRKALRLMRR